MTLRVQLVATMTALGACGDADGSGHIELSGKSPAEGSSLAASAICKREVSCGTVNVACMGGTSMATECSATIVHPEQAACYADVQPSLEKLLSCQALTPEQVNMIEQCFDALAARPCITQAEADALARTEEMTMSLPPSPQLPECNFLEQPLPGC
jgi:hypothetical protein